MTIAEENNLMAHNHSIIHKLGIIGGTRRGKTVFLTTASGWNNRFNIEQYRQRSNRQLSSFEIARVEKEVNQRMQLTARPFAEQSKIHRQPSDGGFKAAGNSLLRFGANLIFAQTPVQPEISEEMLRDVQKQLDILNTGYRMLENQQWVPPTFCETELTFDFTCEGRQFTINSLDFEGGIIEQKLTEENISRKRKLVNFFSDCDVILFFADPASIAGLTAASGGEAQEAQQTFDSLLSLIGSVRALKNSSFGLVITKSDQIPGFDYHLKQVAKAHNGWNEKARKEAYQVFQGKDVVLGLPYQVLVEKRTKQYFDETHPYYNPKWGRSVENVLKNFQQLLDRLRKETLNLEIFFTSAVGSVDKQIVREEQNHTIIALEYVPPRVLHPKGVVPIFSRVSDWLIEKAKIDKVGKLLWLAKAALAILLLVAGAAVFFGHRYWTIGKKFQAITAGNDKSENIQRLTRLSWLLPLSRHQKSAARISAAATVYGYLRTLIAEGPTQLQTVCRKQQQRLQAMKDKNSQDVFYQALQQRYLFLACLVLYKKRQCSITQADRDFLNKLYQQIDLAQLSQNDLLKLRQQQADFISFHFQAQVDDLSKRISDIWNNDTAKYCQEMKKCFNDYTVTIGDIKAPPILRKLRALSLQQFLSWQKTFISNPARRGSLRNKLAQARAKDYLRLLPKLQQLQQLHQDLSGDFGPVLAPIATAFKNLWQQFNTRLARIKNGLSAGEKIGIEKLEESVAGYQEMLAIHQSLKRDYHNEFIAPEAPAAVAHFLQESATLKKASSQALLNFCSFAGLQNTSQSFANLQQSYPFPLAALVEKIARMRNNIASLAKNYASELASLKTIAEKLVPVLEKADRYRLLTEQQACQKHLSGLRQIQQLVSELHGTLLAVSEGRQTIEKTQEIMAGKIALSKKQKNPFLAHIQNIGNILAIHQIRRTEQNAWKNLAKDLKPGAITPNLARLDSRCEQSLGQCQIILQIGTDLLETIRREQARELAEEGLIRYHSLWKQQFKQFHNNTIQQIEKYLNAPGPDLALLATFVEGLTIFEHYYRFLGTNRPPSAPKILDNCWQLQVGTNQIKELQEPKAIKTERNAIFAWKTWLDKTQQGTLRLWQIFADNNQVFSKLQKLLGAINRHPLMLKFFANGTVIDSARRMSLFVLFYYAKTQSEYIERIKKASNDQEKTVRELQAATALEARLSPVAKMITGENGWNNGEFKDWQQRIIEYVQKTCNCGYEILRARLGEIKAKLPTIEKRVKLLRAVDSKEHDQTDLDLLEKNITDRITQRSESITRVRVDLAAMEHQLSNLPTSFPFLAKQQTHLSTSEQQLLGVEYNNLKQARTKLWERFNGYRKIWQILEKKSPQEWKFKFDLSATPTVNKVAVAATVFFLGEKKTGTQIRIEKDIRWKTGQTVPAIVCEFRGYADRDLEGLQALAHSFTIKNLWVLILREPSHFKFEVATADKMAEQIPIESKVKYVLNVTISR